MSYLTLGTELSGLAESLGGKFSQADIISLVTDGIEVAAPFAIMWFGIRYIKRAVVKGVFKGRI